MNMESLSDIQAWEAGLTPLMEGIGEEVAQHVDAHNSGVRKFLEGIGPVVEVALKAQKRLDRYVASKFSVFEYFRENENIVSAIFADLLRPDGSHGQGTKFLGLLLKEIDRHGNDKRVGDHKEIRNISDYRELEPCEVITEYVIMENRRIDITVRIGDHNDEDSSKWIGIENKPWTIEQPDQLKDYLEFLHKQEDDKACILYFSGDGSESRTIPASKEKFYLTVPYRRSGDGPSVEHWVEECAKSCEAENVRWFLKDLLRYIHKTFHEAETLDDE